MFPAKTVLAASSASLTLSPASGRLGVGTNLEVSVLLNTGGAVVEKVDTKIIFDKDKLEVVSITPASLFSSTPGRDFDNTSGTIAISSLASTASPVAVTVPTSLAVVKFKSKAAGQAEVNFDFTLNAANDSNVIEQTTKKDILTSTSGAIYTILGTKTTPSTTPGVGDGDKIPKSGAVENTLALLFIGSVLLSVSGWLWKKA